MKEKIIRASVTLFEAKGFSATSIRDITDSIGVTKGTFYYYFKTKEQLLMEIHKEYITRLLSRQQAILENAEWSSGEKLRAMIGLLIMDIRKNGSSGRVFFREIRHLSQANIRAVTEDRDRFRLNIEAVIREGAESGEFRKDLRPDMAAFGILGMANYSYNWFDPEGEVNPEELAAIYTGMVLEGMKSGEGLFRKR